MIRRATGVGAVLLAEFAARAFVDADAPSNAPADVELHLARTGGPKQQAAGSAAKGSRCLLALEAGSIVGYACLQEGSAHPAIGGPVPWELRRFYVDHARHGGGVAVALMAAAVAEARAASARTLWRTVREASPRARRFYAKSGFVDVGHTTFLLGRSPQTDRLLVRRLDSAECPPAVPDAPGRGVRMPAPAQECPMHPLFRPATGLAVLALLALSAAAESPAPASPAADPALAAAIASPARDARFVARDAARHPLEELTFFGLQPPMTVVELWPGGGYWTEILGPYLAKQGRYYVALPLPGNAEEDAGVARWRSRVAAQKDRLGTIVETTLGLGHFDIAPAGSADLVLTFRNIHNWMEAGYVEDVLAACYKALKPGGILGVEGHRGRADKPQDPKAANGYVREDYAIALAQKAGFEFVGSSEIDANPKDTKDWVDGVWTLPPTLSQGEKDKARYLAIGEADNFVLKFRKPAR